MLAPILVQAVFGGGRVAYLYDHDPADGVEQRKLGQLVCLPPGTPP